MNHKQSRGRSYQPVHPLQSLPRYGCGLYYGGCPHAQPESKREAGAGWAARTYARAAAIRHLESPMPSGMSGVAGRDVPGSPLPPLVR